MIMAQAVIFFDGVCNLCNRAVQFIITHDRSKYFKFAALQSDVAEAMLPDLNLKVKRGDSFILVENGKVFEQSTAALRVAKKLGGLWPLLYGFIIVPPLIRNAAYRFIARSRYKWFGRRESCWIPTPELKNRFLD
jgi:predicted DCC family thiol-disulfide oxidoreductase YuxK